jgi:hypothetical protein
LSSLRSSGQALSAAKDLSAAEILRCAQDDTLDSASFDSQNVFFEMDWPLWPTCESVLEDHGAASTVLFGTVIDEAGCSEVLAGVPHGFVDGELVCGLPSQTPAQ